MGGGEKPRKSSKAKEKKQKRLEERAAMDAVCAKVEAANKVSVPPGWWGEKWAPQKICLGVWWVFF
uniref:Uncharacterized protein n=1 Tax=Falco tinnunculus TaxID=100819 RepID=A0A8C4UE23_FALTI